MKPTLAVCLICFATTATGALAGGPTTAPVEPAPVAPAGAPSPSQDWTGFYLGGQIGRTSGDWIGGGGATISDASAGSYGLHAGYNHDFGSWILGAEVEHDVMGLSFFVPAVGPPIPGPEVESITRLKLRAGFDLGRVLVYGTVGVAQIKADTLDFENAQVLGAGISWMATPDWIAGAEVLRQNFEGDTGNATSIDATSVSLRLSYKF